MNKTLLVAFPILFSVFMASSGVGQQMSDYIDVGIVNNSGEVQQISVYDNVCGVLILEKRLVRDAETSAQLCTEGMDRGDVTIRNLETGAERRYRGVLGGARLAAP
jgi:hypothetical protein